MNSPKEVAQSIHGAKDNYGLITTDALHQQLNTLTASDWRTAAQTFTKEKAGTDGFYIEDSANGAVTIHNDVRQATSVADQSLNQATMNDIKSNVAGFAAGLEYSFSRRGRCDWFYGSHRWSLRRRCNRRGW